jgi:hypothetical protein
MARHHPANCPTLRLTSLLRLGLLLAWLPGAAALAEPADTWPVAGQQGIIRFVIVPVESARDRAAYARQIELLCAPGQSCFLNFYTNSSGAPLAVPLPDAIDREATVVFRRSLKQGAELLRWSCRLQVVTDDCF